MDYGRVYSEFIADRRTREGSLVAFDRHHILPRCLGGSNRPENLIRLSYSDHLFAHVLLARIHGGVLVSSALRMAGMKKYQGRSARQRYAFLKSRMREQMLGNVRCVGRTSSGETAEKKRRAWTPEMRQKQRERMLGNRHGSHQSAEARARMSETQLRRYARERGE